MGGELHEDLRSLPGEDGRGAPGPGTPRMGGGRRPGLEIPPGNDGRASRGSHDLRWSYLLLDLTFAYKNRRREPSHEANIIENPLKHVDFGEIQVLANSF